MSYKQCVRCGFLGSDASFGSHRCMGNPMSTQRRLEVLSRKETLRSMDGKTTIIQHDTFGCTDCLIEFHTYADYQEHVAKQHPGDPDEPRRPSAGQLGPSTTTEPDAALVIATWVASEQKTASLEGARDFAGEVKELLRRMGFSIELVTGSVVTAPPEVKEAEYDFTDFCAVCEKATEAQQEWDNEEPPYRMGERPDRFCLFHRGYVSGAIAQRDSWTPYK